MHNQEATYAILSIYGKGTAQEFAKWISAKCGFEVWVVVVWGGGGGSIMKVVW
jgi:predicted Rossmann-fold nucleotide-binding protein